MPQTKMSKNHSSKTTPYFLLKYSCTLKSGTRRNLSLMPSSNNRERSMNKQNKTRITNRNKRESGKWLKRQLFGGSSTRAFMTKMETISKDPYKLPPIRSALPRRLQMIIFCKSEVEKNMALISTKKSIVKLAS